MEENKLKFAFFGTPDVASRTLQYLIDHGYIPEMIITSVDKPSGRGMAMHESPVAILASKYNIQTLKQDKLDEDFINKFKSYNLDLSIVVAYGKILKEELINIPKYGTINIHYSLLPKYRGASPLESALLSGDEETGVCIQQMQFKLDSGPILSFMKIPIDIKDTKEILKDKLIEAGNKMLIDLIPNITSSNLYPISQDENFATFCKKIKKEDGDLTNENDDLVKYNKYRAFETWPGVYYFTEKDGRKLRIKITKAHYDSGRFIIDRVIPEGKKEMDYIDLMRNNS